MRPFTTTHFVQKGEPDYATSYMAGDPNAFTQPMVTYDTWVEPVPEQHIPHDELAVYRGMDVRTGEGKVGTVDELVVDPDSGNITHLLMRKGHLWGKKDVAIPVTAIDVVDSRRGLPEHRQGGRRCASQRTREMVLSGLAASIVTIAVQVWCRRRSVPLLCRTRRHEARSRR